MISSNSTKARDFYYKGRMSRDEIIDEVWKLLELIEMMPADSDTQLRVSQMAYRLKVKLDAIIVQERHQVDNLGRPVPHNQSKLDLK